MLKNELLTSASRPVDTSNTVDRITVRIPVAEDISGFSRSEIYRRAGRGEIVMLKCGRSTLVDVASLRAAIAALPRAEIRAPRDVLDIVNQKRESAVRTDAPSRADPRPVTAAVRASGRSAPSWR